MSHGRTGPVDVREIYECKVARECLDCGLRCVGPLAARFMELAHEAGLELFIIVKGELHVIARVQVRLIPHGGPIDADRTATPGTRPN